MRLLSYSSKGSIMKGIKKTLLLAVFLCGIAVAAAQNINNPNKMGPLGTQVNTMNGNLFIPRDDIFISARGFDLELAFYYNSYNLDEDWGYGKGWSFEYNIRYDTDTSGNKILTWGDGREDKYSLITGGSYKTPKGFYDTLIEYQPGKFLLQELDGVKYFFDNATHKRITKLLEPNGNAINFVYTDTLLTSLANTAGQSISFTYNSNGRLASIIDTVASPTRTYTYTYDASGNLMEVVDPLGGKNKYSYLINGPMKTLADKNNNILDIIYYPDYSTREIIGCNKRISFSYDTLSNKTIATDHLTSGENQVTTYTYEKIDNIGWITSISGNCCGYNLLFEYDDQGNKTKETDANGNVYKYTYDSKGNMLTMTDPLNQVSTYTYTGSFNNVSSFTDPKGNVYSMQYDVKGNLTQLTTPGNLVYTATYNSNGDITSSTDPKGNTYTYNYDAYGNPANVTGPNGYSAVLSFNARGKLLSLADAANNTYTTEFDILDRLKKITDPMNNNVRVNYDAEGNITSLINKNNETTTLYYDASNRIVKVKGPTGNQTERSYDAMDNLISTKNALGNTKSFSYDTRNRIKETKGPLNNSSAYGYDNNGNITSVTSANGQTINYTYDKLNRITSIADITGNIASFVYDKNNNLTSYKKGTGATVTYTYDNLDRTKQITDALGNTSSYVYDNNSNITSVTDRNGFTKNYTYDSLNRTKTYTDNNGFVITMSYDVRGNIAQTKDQNNNITTYGYDNINRLVTTTYPDAKFLQYGYDVKNNLISKRLTDGTIITFQYDTLNRVISKTLPGGGVYSYSYDAAGRITSATNNNGTITLTYDNLNRIISETFDGRTVRHDYNIAGRTQTTVYPDSTIVTRSFDTRNRLISITKNNAPVVSYEYNNANQPTKKTFANSVSTNMQYDFANRLSSISTANGSIQNTTFTYDKEMNKTAINRLNNPALSEQFSYDNGYRLTNYKRGPIGSPVIQNSYTYDAVGNRTLANLNGTNTNYSINNLNQITAASGGQNIPFTYDGRGNLTYDGTFYKIYDSENRLLKDSSSPANVITYNYDPFNRRVAKSINGSSLKYTYSGIAQIEERDGSNNLLSRTVFTNFLSPVMNEKNGSRYYYHQNELNSVEAITNNSGRLLERYQYDVYGKPSRYDSLGNPLASSLAGNRFGFTGQEYDSASGSYRFFYRNYSPETGIFNQRDLIGYADGMGMYQYVGNNPANGVDVLGLKKDPCPPKPTPSSNDFENGNSQAGTLISGANLAVWEIDDVLKLSKTIENDQALVKTLLNQGKFSQALALSKTIGQNLNTLKGLPGAEKILQGGGQLSKLSNGMTAIDVAFKAYALKTAYDNWENGTGDGYQVLKASGNLGQSSLGFTPIGSAYNLFDLAQDKLTDAFTNGNGQSMNDNAEYSGQYLGDLSAKYSYSEYTDREEFLGKYTNFYSDYEYYEKWINAKQKQEDRIRNHKKKKHKDPCPPSGGTRKPRPRRGTGSQNASTQILGSHDPNLIIGPDGQPDVHWVSVKDRMSYKILYENSAEATAPAKYVRITNPVEPKQDVNTFLLGDFGFNSTTFTVPPNTSAYYNRLDVRDSIGLYVDITAGYDQVNNVFFWEFQSIDPITLQPPADPRKGFLLLQDSNSLVNGHGFVNFSIKPKQNALTLDTIGARASIVFDENDTIPTNIHTNTIDAFAPTSHMNAITSTTNPITISWSGTDDTGGCGIDHYSIYVSTDMVNYTLFIPRISRTDTTFSLPPDSTYCFFVLATDRVENQETLRPGEIKCTYVGPPLPVTWLYFRGKTVAKDNILDWATANEQNSKQFDVERSLNATDFSRIGIVNATGNSSQTNTYQYTDRNIDRLNSEFMFYRLKQIDIDGNFKYSNIVRLRYNEKNKANTIVYPNPTPGLITILVGDNTLVGSVAVLYDINGRLLENIKISASSQVVDLSKYTNGVYFIRLSNKEVLKVVKN